MLNHLTLLIQHLKTYANILRKELKKFYAHLGTYVVMSLFFFILNLVTSNGHWWFYWPVLGWGLGVALNAVKVFAYGSGWEENKAKEILEKEQNKKWQ